MEWMYAKTPVHMVDTPQETFSSDRMSLNANTGLV